MLVTVFMAVSRMVVIMTVFVFRVSRRFSVGFRHGRTLSFFIGF